MRVEVLLFGPQAALAGCSQVVIETAGDQTTAAELLTELAQCDLALADSIATSRLAVNHEFASEGQPIKPGDEVALIGMVSGG